MRWGGGCLTLSWRCEAHSLGQCSQHRLFCQPKTQPPAQGSGRKGGLASVTPASPASPAPYSLHLTSAPGNPLWLLYSPPTDSP